MSKIIQLFNADNKSVFYEAIKPYADKQIIVVSDPPFNIGYKYNTYKDRQDEDSYYTMLEMFFKDYPSVVIHYPEALYKLAFQIGKLPERVY